MADIPQFEDALALVLRLSPRDRLKLVERVVSSVENELESSSDSDKDHWGNQVLALLDQLDLTDWEAIEIDDPVEWVKNLRRKREEDLQKFWHGDA
jgi:hypothetical protein